MVDVTTIKISSETRERLTKLKEYERETFDEILNKILYVLNICKKDPEKAKKFLENIDRRIKKREIMRKRIKGIKVDSNIR
ncbi:MAG: hypothetical protein QXW97_01355 [Candidatus Pacearchaeota archaeon]